MKYTCFFAIAAVAVLAGCGGASSDPTSRWQREIEEPALNLTGLETIGFNSDSTFEAVSDMIFAHSDSALSCSMRFRVTIDGRWRQTAPAAVEVIYNPLTLRVDTVAGSFALEPLRSSSSATVTDSVRTLMRNGLAGTVTDYYSRAYSALASAGPLLYDRITVAPDFLSATLLGQPILWTPSPPRNESNS